MDRPRSSKRDWSRLRWIAAGFLALAIASLALRQVAAIGPTLPELDRDVVWIGEVVRGPMAIEVKAPGRLVPEDERWLTAPADGVVERILVEPGDRVASGEVVLELSSPALRRELLDAELSVRAEEAATHALRSRLTGELLDLESGLALVDAELREAELRLAADERLVADGLVPPLELAIGRQRLQALRSRAELERRRLDDRRQAMPTELAAQQVRADKATALSDYLGRQVAALSVSVAADGIVTEVIPKVGDRLALGDPVVRAIDPRQLRAELDVPQVRARDLRVGQAVVLDTRNGQFRGHVRRIDPAVLDGVVRVDVAPDGPLPDDARAELRVDGTIEIEHLGDVLHTRRPQAARASSSLELYRLGPEGDVATRVRVELGRLSVGTVQILSGLEVGDRIILSDTSTVSEATRIRLR